MKTLQKFFLFLKINSILYKFEDLKFFCINNGDILLIDETKVDSSFPDAQFFIEGYNKPLRLNLSGRSGGLNFYKIRSANKTVDRTKNSNGYANYDI